MLIISVAPSLVNITRAQLGYACRNSLLIKSTNKNIMTAMNKMSTSVIAKKPNDTTSGVGPLLRTYNLTYCKAYSTKQPELPSKQELEKYFFKVTVVIWDLVWTICIWSWAMCRKHIINNPVVQAYWKTFNQKLDEARKN